MNVKVSSRVMVGSVRSIDDSERVGRVSRKG